MSAPRVLGVVELPDAGCALLIEAAGVVTVVKLDAGQAIDLGHRLLDGGTPALVVAS